MKVILLNLPSPPHRNIYRDYAGGFGLATPSKRTKHGHDIHVIPPLFDAYAAAILEKEDVKVSILDAQVRDLNLTQLLQYVEKQRPNIVVGRISLPSFHDDLEVMNRIKETNSFPVIIGWGVTCKVLPEEALMKSNLDLVIRDELEFTLPEVVKTIEANGELNEVKGISFKQNNKIIHNSNRPTAENLDVLPLPAYHLLDMEKYVVRESLFYPESSEGKLTRFFSVLSSRGCSYTCIYCPYPIGFGQPWRAMSAGKTVDEIEHLAKNYNVKGIWFRDQTFSMDIKRSMAICDEILDRGLEIRWVCETRADKLPSDLLKKMRRAGCTWVFIGVETGDPHLLRTIGKPGYTIEKIEQAFRMARQEGIKRIFCYGRVAWRILENNPKHKKVNRKNRSRHP